jgi:hypothetical protein
MRNPFRRSGDRHRAYPLGVYLKPSGWGNAINIHWGVVAGVAGFLLFVGVLFWAVQADNSTWETRNMDPKKEAVWVTKRIMKICDGTSLIYKSDDGMTVSKNDPECV